MPVEAKAKTKAGIKAVASYWMAAWSYMVATGDSSYYLRLSTSACEWCTGLAKVYEATYRAGGSYSGELVAQPMQVLLVGMANERAGYIQFRVELPAHTKIPAKGAAPERKKRAIIDYTLNLRYLAGGWKVIRASWNTVREG